MEPPEPPANYSEIVRVLDRATGFDLYRLYVAIGKLLEAPKRISEVK